MTIRVKHLIEYLSRFDPETTVYLDKDGWESDLPAYSMPWDSE